MVQTRSMTRYAEGEKVKDVVQHPLVANLIVDSLLEQKDWMSVMAMRNVFRMDDDMLRAKLQPWKKQNEENQYSYQRHFFDDKLARMVVRIRTVNNFNKRIKLHNDMFWYAYENLDVFEASIFYDHVFDVLMHYIRNEPFYEREGILFMRHLFPQTFYETDLMDQIDDHESMLFDDDY
jgi:hypothetical protein